MKSKIAKQIITDTAKAYEQISGHFSATRQYNWQEIKKITDKYVKPRHSILDLGCGNGRLLSILPDQINYLGLDFSVSLIKEAKKYALKHKKNNQKVTFRVSSLLNLDSLKDKYDCIFAIASLHHVPSDQYRNQVVKGISQLLKPEGIFIMTNWNLFQPKYIKYINQNSSLDPNLDPNDSLIPWHNQEKKLITNRFYHAFDQNEIKQLLQVNGFRVIKNYIKDNNLISISKKGGEKIVKKI